MKHLTTKDFFDSTEMSLIAALMCYGYHIEAIDKQNPQKAVFWIKRDDNLDNLLKEYWSRKMRIDPIAFFSCTKEIKARLYNREP